MQVVSNLLNNAAKYTPDGGRINLRLSCDAQNRALTLTVIDNGNGIDAAFMLEIFNLFTQDARSIDRSQGGLGLGLALVKKLMELHGGSVSAASAGANQGATFTLRMPCALETLAEPATPLPTIAEMGGLLRIQVVDDNADAAQ